MVRQLPACAHTGGSPATDALGPEGWLMVGVVVVETFSGAWVAALCDELADLVVVQPAAAGAAARKVATTIRARLGLPAHCPLK